MKRANLTAQTMASGAVLLAVVIGAFSLLLVAIHNLRDSSRDTRAAEQRIAVGSEFERRVIDLETGARGFLITGQQRFLEPRNAALRILPRLKRQMLALERDPQQLAELRETFSRLAAYNQQYLNPLFALAQRNPVAALTTVRTADGKRRVDDLRRRLDAYLSAEAAEAQQSRNSADASASHAILVAILGLLAVPLLFALAIFQMSRRVVTPLSRVALGADGVRSGDLDARVEEVGVGEVRSLAESFNAMADSLRQGRDELESQNAELEAQQGEMERTVDELEEERNKIQGFYDFLSRIAAETAIEPLGAALLEELSNLVGADAATLYAVESNGAGGKGQLRLVASRGFDRGHLALAIESGHGLAGRALAEGRMVGASHGETGLELPAFGQSVRLRHELHLPIGRPGGMIGIVSLARLGDPGFSQAQRERLGHHTGPAAVVLANALSLEASERSAQFSDAVLRSAQDAFIAVDEDGVVLRWTAQATAIYGYAEQEAVGCRLSDLVMSPDDGAAHDQRRQQAIDEAKRGARLERYEVWGRRKDGSSVLCEVSPAAVLIGPRTTVSYFVRDVTERMHRAQEQAADEAVSRALAELEPGDDIVEPILAALCESLDWPVGGFWEFDEERRAVRCMRIWIAPSFEFPELAEYSRQIEYRPGEEVPDFPILKRAWDAEEALWEVLLTPDQLTERQETARGIGLRASAALPVRSGSRMLGLLTFGSREVETPDERRWQALRSIADLVGQVMERRSAEHEAQRMKDDFFALVSHELRTPLTSIVGYLDIVREEEAGEINDDQRRYLEVIDRNARRLTRLVGDLLFVAQVEAGRLALNKSADVALEEIASDAVEAAGPRAEKQGVTLSADLEPVIMHGADPDRLGQLVDNLVSNAIKFTPEGGTVGVRLRKEADRATLEVVDTGMGITAADQDHLFSRFYRTDDAAKLAIPGIGLGLSISKAIAEGHGGAIGLESEEGQGTTFRVELPLRRAAESEIRAARTVTAAPAAERR